MSLLPPNALNTVIAMGETLADGKTRWLASGFLFGKRIQEEGSTPAEAKYRPYLITNRHVVTGRTTMKIRLTLRDDIDPKEYDITIDENSVMYPTDPDIDLAATALNVAIFQDKNVDLISDDRIVDDELFKSGEISEGDFVYLLGFPLGLVGSAKNYVVARHGSIARLQHYLAGESKEIIIDAMNFPGNSGGPVFIKPEIAGIAGTKAHKRASLLGVVRGYIPYRDVAVSAQTGEPRVIFEDNSGLAAIIPAKAVLELVMQLEEKAQKMRVAKPESTIVPSGSNPDTGMPSPT